MPLPSSTAFKNNVVNAHHIRSRAQLLHNGVAQPQLAFKVIEGNATDDRSNAVRAKCSVSIIDPQGTYVPSTSSDWLFPGYNEIQLFRGIYLPGTTTVEEFSLGVFGFDTVQSNESGQKMAISISGFDRSQKVSDAKFLDETVVSGAIVTIIQNIVSPRVPNVTFNLTPTAYTVNQQTYSRGDDPWKACVDLAQSAGMDLYFDRYGVCTMTPFPSTNAPADWTFQSGSQAVMLELDKKMMRSQYNHWIEIAEGSNIAVPFRAEALDQANITASGDRPYFHVSSLFTSVTQCQAAANAQKAANAGATESIQLTTIPNPAILVNDLIQIINARTKTNALYIVDKVTTPLVATTGQNLTTRVRVV